MPLVRTLYERFQVVIHEVAKFGVVGAFNAVLDIALFNWLRAKGVGPLTSNAVSITVAATSSYFMNRHWAFAHRARSGIKREYVLFIVLSAVGLVIVEVCLAVSHYGLGFTSRALADNVAAKGIGLVLGTLWRFWSFKRWVFLPNEPGVPTAAEAAISTTS